MIAGIIMLYLLIGFLQAIAVCDGVIEGHIGGLIIISLFWLPYVICCAIVVLLHPGEGYLSKGDDENV